MEAGANTRKGPGILAGRNMQNQSRKVRRTPNACVSCRKSKIKCSGTRPCNNCQRRLVVCRFEEGANKVTVSERYLHELRRRASEGSSSRRSRQSAPSTFEHDEDLQEKDENPRSENAVDEHHQDEHLQAMLDSSMPEAPAPHDHPDFVDMQRIWTSPFSEPSTTISNTHNNNRNWIWLAPSSTWSFTTRLTLLVTSKLRLESQHSIPQLGNQDVYSFQWNAASGAHAVPDTTGLPSYSHALYLFETVKFRLGHNIRLFDEQAFAVHLQEFYSGDSVQQASASRVWFVQFLLVLAFGNAFLGRMTKDGEPPGSKFFIRAMALMPDFASLWKDSLLAIEVSALAGLYLYSLNQREAGHVYVAQAIRIAQLEGLHTHLPESELGASTIRRCRNLWWTLYTLDRHLSSSLGLPMSTQDGDITAQPQNPADRPKRDSTFTLQTKLYRSLSSILASVYQSQQIPLTSFLEITRSILHRMAGHAEEIEAVIRFREQESIDAISQDTRHIMLLYHQCVIVATRPLLLSLLRGRLELLGQGEGQNWQSFLVQTRPIIAAGIKSANKTIQILSADDGLLEAFLPFDLEFTFEAAIYVAMSNALFLPTDEAPTHHREAQAILDDMILKGNKVAQLRKAELSHLEFLLDEVSKRVRHSGMLRLTVADPQDAGAEFEQIEYSPGEQALADELSSMINGSESAALTVSSSDTPFAPQLHDHPDSMDNEILDIIGISSGDFMSIVDQIDVSSFNVDDPLDHLT